MGRLFGTDGIRGVANRDLTPDLALAVGRAVAHALSAGEVVVGRDTRISGPMLEAALTAGLCSAGADVHSAGIMPSPGIAFLTTAEKATAGAVVSASHNPVADNGIKFFSSAGTKLSSDLEEEIERSMAEPSSLELPEGDAVGRAEPLGDGADRYVDHLLGTLDTRLTGLRVVLDCAYGAAWQIGPRVFREAGADVVAINAEPDGTRINVDCGSTAMDGLAKRVVAEGADIGLAFDGDADRVLAVDETGSHIDGDRILALCAMHLQDAGLLHKDVVVATVMANLGFRRLLEARGIEVVAAQVGDKFVAHAMAARGAAIGGEQSGHLIFSQHATTGDGLLTGLQVAQILEGSASTFSRVADLFEPFPQVLINVPVVDRDGLEGAESLWSEVAAVEDELGDDGRVLLRASGTEPLVRVMVEAADATVARGCAERLAAAVEASLGRR
ncbi:MAG TPA: phosphoglucosamine mutase [Actinomycetota bacterium]|nr:phosphoglucosamine mutase [Actinomycetota bacterium]